MRKGLLAAMAALGCVFAVTPGCSEDGDTIINQIAGGGTVLPGNFPGAPETTHYVAPDGGGLSASSHTATALAQIGGSSSLSTGLRFFPSGVGGTGIALYITFVSPNFVLWATYYDGSTFTPPVALGGANENTGVPPFLSEACCLFLNTTDSLNGDAMIFWRRMDLDSTTPTERLYYSYFDVSLKSTAASSSDPEVRYGFDTTAATIDQGPAIADVTALAVFSDGLHGQAIFIGDFAAPLPGGPPFINFNINLYQQGDATSFAGVAYIQAPNGTTGPRVHYRSLDFSTGSLRANMTLPMPSGAAAAADTVTDLLYVYDGSIFFLANDTANTETDLAWNVFGTTQFQLSTNSATINPSGTNHAAGLPEGLVGPDEGVVNVVGVHTVDNLGAAGNKDLWAFQVDPSTATFNSTNDRVEIDDDLAPANANQPVVGVPFGGNDSVELAVNRTGEWLLVTWLQDRGNTGTGDNGVALWARGIQLTRSGTAPALNTRVTNNGGAAFQVDAVTADSANDDFVKRYKFQDKLEYGGIQSDRYTAHVIWQQDSGTAGTDDQVRTRGITFTPSSGAGAPGQLNGGTAPAGIVFLDGDLNLDASNAMPSGTTGPGGWGSVFGADGGGSGSGNFTGGLILGYVRNSGSAASPSFDAVLRRQTGASTWSTINVGSLATGGTHQAISMFGGVVPNNDDITGQPDYAGNGLHLGITEVRESNQPLGNSTNALRHRYFDKTSSDVEANRFTPQITSGSPPVGLDDGSNGSAFLAGAGGNGETVGLWFLHNGHLWYQQWNPSSRSWYTNAGAAAPELVDHGNPAQIFSSGSIPQLIVQTQPAVASPTNELSKAMIFWQKIDSLGGTIRWYARPRD